jgi:succinate dehydrogenase / fumarate reductase cytochrome b subunit
MNYKYIESLPTDPNRYFEEMVHKFVNPIRVVAYVVSFGFLMLHLLHGFSSSFQSVGLNNKYTRGLKSFTIAFSIVIPVGFIFIAIFHHLNA